MGKNTYIAILLLFTVIFILLSSSSVESIRKGDVYEYNFYFTIDMNMIFKTNVYNQTPFEVRFSYDINGIMKYKILDISRGNLRINVNYENLKTRHSFSCNESRIESLLRSGFNETIRNIEEMFEKDFEISIPYINPLRYDPSKDTWINSMMDRVIPGYSDIMKRSDYTSSVIAKRSTYKGVMSLLTNVEANINYDYGGVLARIRIKSISHSDLLATITYYSDSEVEGKTITYYYEYPYQFEASMNFKYRLVLELRNIGDQREYKSIGLEVKFRDKKGELFIIGHNSILHGYKISGNKLILNVTGTGSGGVYINLSKNINVLDINVDGKTINYIRDDLNERIVVRAPIDYSEHLVEIEFSEQLSEASELETEVSPLYLYIIILLFSAILVIIVFIIVLIVKYRKKT